MKWVWNIIGAVLLIVGIIWFFQGVGVLPGSFMTGNILYAVLGVILDVVGIIVFIVTNRRSRAVASEDVTKTDQQ